MDNECYFLSEESIAKGPKILKVCSEWMGSIPLLGFIYSLYSTIIRTDLVREYKVCIYKSKSINSKKELVYCEKVPDDITQTEYNSKTYYLERAIEKGTIEEILKKLLTGENNIF